MIIRLIAVAVVAIMLFLAASFAWRMIRSALGKKGGLK